MASGIVAAIGSLLGILAMFMEWWMSKAPARKEEAQIEKLDDFREAVAKGDTATVSGMLSNQHDRVQSLCHPASRGNGADNAR